MTTIELKELHINSFVLGRMIQQTLFVRLDRRDCADSAGAVSEVYYVLLVCNGRKVLLFKGSSLLKAVRIFNKAFQRFRAHSKLLKSRIAIERYN